MDQVTATIAARRSELQHELELLDKLDATIAGHVNPDPQPITHVSIGGREISAPAPAPETADPPPAVTKASEPPPRRASAPRAPRANAVEVERKIVSALLQHPNGMSKPMLLEKTKFTPSALSSQLSRMVAAGQIERVGATKSLRYKMIPREPTGSMSEKNAERAQRNDDEQTRIARAIALRDKVMKAIAADPDSLTEDRLAMALDTSREAIAEACEKLRLDGRVIIHADDTYSLAGNGRAALAA